MMHIFDVDIAKEYGVNAAVLLQNLGYWINRNKANEINFYDGNYWTYNSRRAYRELFPYMSERQIETAFKKLIDAGIIITGNYNELKYDRTLWYALTEKGKCILHFDGMEADKKENGSGGNVPAIPDINADGKPNFKPDKKPARHKYGEYGNVLLSDEELTKLQAEFPQDWQERIERLSSYIASSGKRYRNHLATIRNWARSDREKAAPQKSGKDSQKMPSGDLPF